MTGSLVLGHSTLAWGLAGVLNHWTGGHWANAPERPETFLPSGVLLLAAGVFGAAGRSTGFPRVCRVTGIVFLLLPMVLLASLGWLSFLPWEREPVETTYQVLGFVLSAGAIWLGVSRRWSDLVYSGTLFFIVQLVKVARNHLAVGVVPGTITDSISRIDGITTLRAQIRTPCFVARTGNSCERLATRIGACEPPEITALSGTGTGDEKAHVLSHGT